MAESSILDIVRNCQRDPRDRDAFDRFYRTLYPYVRLYVRAFRLPTVPLTEEDMIQEIFLKLMEHFPEIAFKSENQFLAYLKAVSENYIIDMVRKYERQTFEELSKAELVSRSESPEQTMVRTEWREQLFRTVAKLTGHCQNLLRAFLVEELSLAEIARRQSVPLGTIYPRFSRCVAELRRQIERARSHGL